MAAACASALSPERAFDLSGTTPSLRRRAQHLTRRWLDARSPLAISDSRRMDGAFMEPSGRNQWQPVANGRASKTAQTSRSATGGNPRQRFHGKEGVNGSSPLEGFSEAPAQQLLSLSPRKTFRSGGVHETSTAPNVSELAMLKPPSRSGFAGSAATST
jgi:hypothetical protein